jgi:hypothetical protein
MSASHAQRCVTLLVNVYYKPLPARRLVTPKRGVGGSPAALAEEATMEVWQTFGF